MVELSNKQRVNNLESNFRSDVVAAGMVDAGIDADKMVVLRRQGNTRQTDKEILEIEYKQDYVWSGKDMWIIKSNRQGIYDKLPEGLFHNSTGLNDNSKEAIIHSFRKQSTQERWIRQFFSLYEAELERARIDFQLEEYRYDRSYKYRAFVDTLSTFWPVVKNMDARTAMLFLRTIPFVTEIRNSYMKISNVLSLITGYSVRIENNTCRMPVINHLRLKDMRLGIDSVLKGNNRIPCLKVMVTPDRENIKELTIGKRQYNILKTLLDIFMPALADYQLAIVPKVQDCTSQLGDKDNPCMLGVNMKLKINM